MEQRLSRLEETYEQRFSRFEETYEQRFSRFEETFEHRFSRLEEMIAELCERRGLLMRRIDGDEEQYPVMDDETDLLGTRTIVDPKAEIREGLVHKAISEKESIPQFQVPIANSEIVRSIEPGKVDLGLENEEYVVLNENLEQEWDQKVQGIEKICSAHKVFVKMPGKEKRMKHLKAWKFKFKSTSKRSKSMDVKFFYVEEIALLNKDPKETIWNCVEKEFKETLAACGMKRVDQFKLADEKESRLEVLDLNQTFMYHQIGHGVDILPVRKMLVHDKEMAVILQRSISLLKVQLDWLERADSNHEKESDKKLRKLKLHQGRKSHKTWMFKYKSEMRFMTSKQKGFPRESEAKVFFLDGNSLVTTISLEVDQLLRQFQELFEKLSLAGMKLRMIGRVWKSFGYLMEDMMEEDQKLQGDNEPLLTVPDFAAKICETFDQYIRKKRPAGADRESASNQPTLRFSTWVIEILLNHYMVLLLTSVAYAIQFLGGVGMDKKQSHLSLWINRVWDPGRSLVKDDGYSTRIFSSLPATVPVSLLCQESFAYQITSFSTNLEVKVSLKGEDLIQEKKNDLIVSDVSEVNWKLERRHVE